MGTDNLIFHCNLTGDDLHVPGYVQDNDPGTCGTGKLWVDTNLGTLSYILKIRNATNTGWSPVAQLWGQLQGNILNQTDLQLQFASKYDASNPSGYISNLSTFTTDNLAEGSTNKYDKTVVLSEGTGISISGSYPNFTITNTQVDIGAVWGNIVGNIDNQADLRIALDSKSSVLHAHSLDSLTNVGVISGLSSGQLLTYDSVHQIWYNWSPNFATQVQIQNVINSLSNYAPVSEPLSLHLDQTTPQTFTNLGGGTGLMKVTAGVLGLDTTNYLQNKASGLNSIAAGGGNAQSSGSYSTAVGNNANASGDYAGAFGYHSSVTSENSLALGHYAYTNSYYATNIGNFNYFFNNNYDFSIQLGGYSGYDGTDEAWMRLSSASVKLLKYTTDGFVKFSGSDGTLAVDTNTYIISQEIDGGVASSVYLLSQLIDGGGA